MPNMELEEPDRAAAAVVGQIDRVDPQSVALGYGLERRQVLLRTAAQPVQRHRGKAIRWTENGGMHRSSATDGNAEILQRAVRPRGRHVRAGYAGHPGRGNGPREPRARQPGGCAGTNSWDEGSRHNRTWSSTLSGRVGARGGGPGGVAARGRQRRSHTAVRSALPQDSSIADMSTMLVVPCLSRTNRGWWSSARHTAADPLAWSPSWWNRRPAQHGTVTRPGDGDRRGPQGTTGSRIRPWVHLRSTRSQHRHVDRFDWIRRQPAGLPADLTDHPVRAPGSAAATITTGARGVSDDTMTIKLAVVIAVQQLEAHVRNRC